MNSVLMFKFRFAAAIYRRMDLGVDDGVLTSDNILPHYFGIKNQIHLQKQLSMGYERTEYYIMVTQAQ